MTDIDTPRASTEEDSETSSTTLHDTLLSIAEHLKDTGDFNEQAYVSLCNIARESYDLRDAFIETLKRDTQKKLEVSRMFAAEGKRAYEAAKKVHVEMAAALRQNTIKVKSVHKHNLAMESIIKTILKTSPRKLRSGKLVNS